MEKVTERDGEEEEGEEEFMGVKLKRSVLVGKRGGGGGPSTPPPTWTTSADPQTKTQTQNTVITARQLGANLWDIFPSSSSSSSAMRRHHHHHRHKELQIQHTVLEEEDLAESSTGVPDQPESTGSFHRQIMESLSRHHRSAERSGRALEPVSSASFDSSMQVTPFNPGATPSSSVELKGRIGDSSYSLKTSTELLKVLNRIWTLEEQHTSNVSLVRSLKSELDNSRVRIKELLKEKQMDRQVIDGLMKQLGEGRLGRRNTDQDRIKSAMQSLREELEDERKLRKRSESLHRKLARELSDMKSSFSKAVGELERERRARLLVEDLCDEFAIGIRDYEQELRSMEYKTERDHACGREHVDNLVLHMSEAWLDERVQMKLGEESAPVAARKGMVVHKLSSEIESFLRAREQSISSRKAGQFFANKPDTKDHHHRSIRRHSLESYHLNESTSAPKNADDDDDEESVDSESNCFELSKAVNDYEGAAKHMGTQKVGSQEAKHNGGGGGGGGMSRLQARFHQHMTKASSLNNGKSQAASSDNPGKSKRFGSRVAGSTNHMVEYLARNNSSSVEGERIHPEDALMDESHGRLMLAGPTSPVKKWESKIGLQDPEASESFSKRASGGAKENSLKAKLLEARSEGRQCHPHSKAATKG